MRAHHDTPLADALYKLDQRGSRHLEDRGAGVTREALDRIRKASELPVIAPAGRDDPLFLAVHGLAVKKSGSAAAVALLMAADPAPIEAACTNAVEHGFAVAAGDDYVVTPAGQEWLAALYPDLCADLRAEQGFAAAYERFETVNRELLALMTRWQTIDIGGRTVTNDHSDPAYDERILDQLDALHERAAPLLREFATFETRLGTYYDLLDQAYERVLDGATDYMSGVRVPSYHTVWFEMHEDLLRLLGRAREP